MEEPSITGIKAVPIDHGGTQHYGHQDSTTLILEKLSTRVIKIYHTDHAGTQHYGNQGFPTLTMEDTVKLHSSQAARKTVSNLAFSVPSSSPAMSLLVQSKASGYNSTELCHHLRDFLEKIISLKKQLFLVMVPLQCQLCRV